MSETARILRDAAHAATHYGLQSGPRLVDTDGRIDLISAIYIGATGNTPHSFTTPNDTTSPFNDMATALIETNEPVMAAIHAVSKALGTDIPTDSKTGLYCHIEHLWYWQIDRRPFIGEPPTEAEVVGLLLRAAHAADTPATPAHPAIKPIPRQRQAA